MKAVPAEIGELVWLEHLSLGDYHIVWLEEKGNWDYTAKKNQQDSNSGLADISALSSLTLLKSLRAANTQVADLRPLAALTALQELNINDTQVTDLTPLSGLIGLKSLWALETQITSLAPLSGLAALETLNCAVTKIHDLAPLSDLLSLKSLGIDNTKVTDLTPLQALIRQGVEVLWDDTSSCLTTPAKTIKPFPTPGFKYWLDVIDLFGGHSPVLLFQNEKGGRSKEIDLVGIKGQFDNVKECYRGNLELDDAANTLREAIEWFAAHLPHIGETLPASWVKVRADIEQRAAHVPHITQQQYFELFSQHLPFDRSKALHLSRYLHDTAHPYHHP